METESRIRGAMSRLLENRTSIVIAHRLSTVLTADRILVMHKGKVAEIGSHEQLINRRGLYWRLFQIQFGHQTETEGAFAEDIPQRALHKEQDAVSKQHGNGRLLQSTL
jgi:ATP-binding cassette subfamily B protein